MRFAIFAMFVMTGACLHALPSSAQEAPGVGSACKADKDKFCAGISAGGGKLRECFKQHASELSAECTGAIRAVRQARRNLGAACKTDAEKFCSAAEKAPGALTKCLDSHAAELDQTCAAALKARQAAKKG
jgi:hypothetical protein